MAKPQRRKRFIDSDVQGALIRRLVGHWALFLTVAFACAFCLQVLSNPFRPLGDHFANLWWTQGPFLVVTVFLLPVFVSDAIKLSHRWVGPVHRLRKTIREIAETGDVNGVDFRGDDFWQEIAGDFNVMLKRLEDKQRAELEQTGRDDALRGEETLANA